MAVPDQPRSVLIVEDECLVRILIADAFRMAGWKVAESSTAEEAIEIVRGERPVDVIFTDIQLAGQLSGWDVGEQCRNLRPEIAIIYTSGNAVDQSRSVEGSLFFAKPYRAAAVLEACNLGQGRARRRPLRNPSR